MNEDGCKTPPNELLNEEREKLQLFFQITTTSWTASFVGHPQDSPQPYDMPIISSSPTKTRKEHTDEDDSVQQVKNTDGWWFHVIPLSEEVKMTALEKNISILKCFTEAKACQVVCRITYEDTEFYTTDTASTIPILPEVKHKRRPARKRKRDVVLEPTPEADEVPEAIYWHVNRSTTTSSSTGTDSTPLDDLVICLRAGDIEFVRVFVLLGLFHNCKHLLPFRKASRGVPIDEKRCDCQTQRTQTERSIQSRRQGQSDTPLVSSTTPHIHHRYDCL